MPRAGVGGSSLTWQQPADPSGPNPLCPPTPVDTACPDQSPTPACKPQPAQTGHPTSPPKLIPPQHTRPSHLRWLSPPSGLRAKSKPLSPVLRPCGLSSHHSPPPRAPAVPNTRLFALPLCPVPLPRLLQVSSCQFLRIQLRPPPPGSLRSCPQAPSPLGAGNNRNVSSTALSTGKGNYWTRCL